MMRMFTAAILLVAVLGDAAHAQRCGKRGCTGCNVCKPVVTATPTKNGDVTVKVENNLIGVPVPFNYGSPNAAQGSSIYGVQQPGSYGLSAFSDTYGSLDPAVLFNQASRFVSQAQQLAGQANNDYMDALKQEGLNRADVAKILARGQSAAAVLNATREDSRVTQARTFTFTLSQNANGGFTVVPNPNVGPRPEVNAGDFSGQSGLVDEALHQVAMTRCAECHNSQASKGSGTLDMTKVEEFDSALLDKVLARITSHAENRMPPPDSGAALTPKELRPFFLKQAILGGGN